MKIIINNIIKKLKIMFIFAEWEKTTAQIYKYGR